MQVHIAKCNRITVVAIFARNLPCLVSRSWPNVAQDARMVLLTCPFQVALSKTADCSLALLPAVSSDLVSTRVCLALHSFLGQSGPLLVFTILPLLFGLLLGYPI